MLVLQRFVGEKITIGEGKDKIVLVISSIVIDGEHRESVKIGIDAPKNLLILRNELIKH